MNPRLTVAALTAAALGAGSFFAARRVVGLLLRRLGGVT